MSVGEWSAVRLPLTVGLGDGLGFENRQPGTAAD